MTDKKEVSETAVEVQVDQQHPKVEEEDSSEEPAQEERPAGVPNLYCEWTMYFDRKQAKPTTYQNYRQNLQKMGAFDTLEGFWKHYSYLKSPDDIPNGHNVFMFRENLVPAWETFPKGGAWIIKVRKKNGVISRLWEELLCALVGELFEEPDIAGCMLSMRRHEDLLSVWNVDNVKNPEVRLKIGERLREILNLDESTQVEYKSFKLAIKDGSSFRNAKAYVYAAQGAYPPPAVVAQPTSETEEQ